MSSQVVNILQKLETGEDDWVGGAATGVEQLDLILVVATDRLEVPGKHAKDGFLVHLDPEEQLFSKARSRDVLTRGGCDPGIGDRKKFKLSLSVFLHLLMLERVGVELCLTLRLV